MKHGGGDHPFRQREQHLFLLGEMAARHVNGVQQTLPRRDDFRRLHDVGEGPVDLFVLGPHDGEWPGLGTESGFQPVKEKLVLEASVSDQRGREERREGPDLDRLLGQHDQLLQPGEFGVEDPMLSQQGLQRRFSLLNTVLNISA